MPLPGAVSMRRPRTGLVGVTHRRTPLFGQLALTAAVGTLTIVPGRANVPPGGVHLSLPALFLFLAASP